MLELRRGSWASSRSVNFAWRSARLTVASSSVRARSMMVRSFGVTGMPFDADSLDALERCVLMPGGCRFVGAVTSIGRPSQRSRSWSAAAA